MNVYESIKVRSVIAELEILKAKYADDLVRVEEYDNMLIDLLSTIVDTDLP